MSIGAYRNTVRQRHWRLAILTVIVLAIMPSRAVLAQPPATLTAVKPSLIEVGVAKVDITPDYPIRLHGFGNRREESAGVRHPIWAKALAIGSDADQPAVLIAVDNLGVPDELTQEIARRLKAKANFAPERLAITATHTHTAPMLNGCAPTIFGIPIPTEHQAHIDLYTREFTDKLEAVALAALKDRQPATLEWGVGTAKFAKNRRTKDGSGPVDHDLPLLVVRDPNGKPRAIYVNYACHCVTLSDNLIGGDWAGYAQDLIERQHPGAVALVSVGCGADQNPTSGVTGDKGEVAEGQGAEIAAEVQRLLASPLRPVSGPIIAKSESLNLAFDTHPTRAEWEEKAKLTNAIGHHARVQLARLDRGESLRTSISYPVQTWAFGDSLGMVFLPGEVVVDYALRLKRELDGRRMWLNAYANASPCYIPSERVRTEGGYEGGGAMVYYDQPTKLAAGLEQKIVDAVKKQFGERFAPPVAADKAQSARPLPPEQSLGLLRTNPGLKVDLVAAEPLIASPVAINFGPDGKLWVAEMADYPLGLDGDYQPGGRIRVLESTRDDGCFDKATVFLDRIPFPTGVTVWRNGVLVCAAPDILYAEDTDGDRRADVVKKLFSGFGTENYQARVNSLEYGLDGWVYGSCGLFGGQITSFAGGKLLKLGDRDFRIKPDTGEIEPATGRTQQGRVRDDWDNWFGCTNGNLCVHYPLADHYLRRNPFVAPPATTVSVPEGAANQLMPASDKLQLFKLSGASGRATAACGLGIYRDNLLGEGYRGNAFTCEPVNLVVHRMQLFPQGSTFVGRRAPEEANSEFLSSTDTWFRPVQARIGPDGALWVVDMYRYVIEHPRWIPAEDLAKVDVRAGHDMGRIYRVRPANADLRPWSRLDRLDTSGLVAALDGPNGWQRDMATQLLAWRADRAAISLLERTVEHGDRVEAVLHAMCALDAMGALSVETVVSALLNDHAGVRRHAARLAESLMQRSPQATQRLLPRVRAYTLEEENDAQLRLQTAYSLGPSSDEWAMRDLARMASHSDDPILVAAVLSSLNRDNLGQFTAVVFDHSPRVDGSELLREKTAGLAAAMGDAFTIARVLRMLYGPVEAKSAKPPWRVLAEFLDALRRRREPIESLVDDTSLTIIEYLLAEARRTAAYESAPEPDRAAAIGALGRWKASRDLNLLAELLTPRNPVAVQSAAMSALGRMSDENAARSIVAWWSGYAPGIKSQALDVMLARDAWTRVLLRAIGIGEILAADVDLTRRQRLLTHKQVDIRETAEKLFAGATNADRQRVLLEHQGVIALTGDHERGRAVFAKSCAACHRLENAGHAIGPDLAATANKTPQFLLQEILDPNRNVDSRFIAYAAATTSGRTFSGLLASETATSITLRAQEGKQDVVLRADLDELVSTRKSLMPEGMEKDLSPQNLADVIAYLTAARGTPKSFPGNSPATITPTNGALVLSAAAAEIYGDQIVFEQPFRNIGYWHGAGDHVVWTVELAQQAEFDAWLDWSCDNASAGNAFILEGGEPALRGEVRRTGSWDYYRQEKMGSVSIASGTHRLTLRPAADRVHGALMDLRAVHLVPKGQALSIAAVQAAPPLLMLDDLAGQILDDSRSKAEREAIVQANTHRAAELIATMTNGLPQDEKEEYRRIPWIWRLAVAAGRKNDTSVLQRLLFVSLPRTDKPLRDWQAVVLGGGIVNGLSLQNVWPKPRLEQLLKDQPDMHQSWAEALRQSAVMADNEAVRTGTRYDALRIIALDNWDRCGTQLQKYLAKGVHNELQMGAISGLSDVDRPEVAPLLLGGFAHYSEGNRKLALDALIRTESRIGALLDAIERTDVPRSALSDAQVMKIREVKDTGLRERVKKVLPE